MSIEIFLKSLVGVGLIAFSAQVFAKSEVKADLFEMGQGTKTQIFKLDQDVTGPLEGHQEMKAVFSDMAGQPAFTEEATLENGLLVKNIITQHQTGEKASIEVRDGQIYFSRTNSGEKEKTASEKLKQPLLVPAAFAHFVKTHWESLAKGEALEFRFAVWQRLETVGFQFKKVKDEGEGDNKVLVLKMKPTSFIISALVDPLTFRYAYKNQRIISYEGRVSPKIKKGDSFKDLDALVVYHFAD